MNQNKNFKSSTLTTNELDRFVKIVLPSLRIITYATRVFNKLKIPL